jgi:hypothetical protein
MHIKYFAIKSFHYLRLVSLPQIYGLLEIPGKLYKAMEEGLTKGNILLKKAA